MQRNFVVYCQITRRHITQNNILHVCRRHNLKNLKHQNVAVTFYFNFDVRDRLPWNVFAFTIYFHSKFLMSLDSNTLLLPNKKIYRIIKFMTLNSPFSLLLILKTNWSSIFSLRCLDCDVLGEKQYVYISKLCGSKSIPFYPGCFMFESLV
jgi:hypothetical protein